MKKRLFQVLDEMNEEDAANGTKMVQVCPSLVTANTAKGGLHVTMGVPGGVSEIISIESQKLIPVLLLLDAEEYRKRIKG